eukprot:CAMPEP_0170564300 /NCGR_PEP_ID=MMETSP0211-20121228/72122_1 /TAXON_ID=311385 /ORGANISM="Pseudokeronopsis sp., Strain OXSARD2" /LENGTH=30 /DNA_ID= /DNA_START= /DNA_END= /DNA_ORIENTATION=
MKDSDSDGEHEENYDEIVNNHNKVIEEQNM